MRKGNKVIKRYSKSLFHSAGIDGSERVIHELSLFHELIEKYREIKSIWINPLFDDKDKKSAIDLIVLRLELSDISKKFIYKLVEDNVITGLPEIISILNTLYLKAKNKSRVTIITPIKPAASFENEVKKALRNTLNREVDLEYATDPSLIGGLVVKAGSTMFDFSIRGQLRLLKDELLRG